MKQQPPLAAQFGAAMSGGPGRVRRTAVRIAVIAAGVACIACLAWWWFGKLNAPGGSASPEAAVTSLAAAIDAEDLVAASTFMAPDEVDGLGELLRSMGSQARAEGMPGFGKGEGLDLSVRLGDVETQNLSPKAALVTMAVSAGADTSKLQGPAAGLLGKGGTIEFDLELVTINLRGGWYVSPMLTAGRYIADEADAPSGDFDLIDAPAPTTKLNTPVESVEYFAKAAATQDFDGLQDVLAPGEGRLLRVFRDTVDDIVSRADFRVRVVDVAAHSAVGGATLSSLELEVTNSIGEQSSAIYRRACLRVDSRDNVCPLRESEIADRLGLSADDLVWIVKRVDGNQRVSLLGSVLAFGAEVVPRLDRQTVLDALNLEYLDDATSIRVGSLASGKVAEGSYVVLESQLKAGKKYRIGDDASECSTGTYASSGPGRWRYDDLYAGDARTVRVVLSCDVATDFNFLLSEVATESVRFPVDTTGILGYGEERVLEFDVDTPGFYELVTSGDAYVSIDDYSGTSNEGYYDLAAGPNRVTVSMTSNSKGTYSVGLVAREPVGYRGFEDGSRRMLIDLSSGSVTVDYYAREGDSVDITATPNVGQDITLYAPDCSDCSVVDSGVGGVSERQSLVINSDGRFSVVIDGYEYDNYYGSVTVELSYG